MHEGSRIIEERYRKAEKEGETVREGQRERERTLSWKHQKRLHKGGRTRNIMRE